MIEPTFENRQSFQTILVFIRQDMKDVTIVFQKHYKFLIIRTFLIIKTMKSLKNETITTVSPLDHFLKFHFSNILL